MTVSRPLSSLNIFQSKVEEALNLVPEMCAGDKLKAVHFWNIVSEKLQDIVNNSAADINAVALTMEEEESVKMNLGINAESGPMATESEISSTEFTNLSPIYAMSSDNSVPYHSSVSNNQLKPFTPEPLIFSSGDKQPSFEVTSSSHNHQLFSGYPELSDSNVQSDQCIPVENISLNSCDSSSEDDEMLRGIPLSEIKRDYTRNKNQALTPKKNLFNSFSPVKDKIDLMESNVSPFSAIAENKNSEHGENCLQELSSQNNNNDFSLKPFDDNPEITIKEQMDTLSTFPNMEENCEPSLESIPETASANSKDEDIKFTNKKVRKGFICTICSKSCLNADTLARHHSRFHEKQYNCSECKAKFSSKSNLLVHMRTHTGEKPFCCSKCPANFTTNGNLQRHIRTHNGDKPWECNKCGTCFTEKKSLTIHMRRHTGERPYQCKVCGKRFSQTSILQTHMSMHSDTKEHLCEVCGKSFRQKSQLRVHRFRHENLRPFKCSTCPLSYITKGDLVRHEKTHTTEKPYKCDVCPKGFTRRQSLNEHKNRHYGIKPYKCKHCGKAFPEMSGCYKHMKVHGKAKNKAVKENNKEQDNEPAPAEIVPEISPNVTADQIIEENEINEMPSETEAPSYIAVVLNAKNPNELGEEINQAVSFLNSGLEENNTFPNGIGVLTAINILTNGTTFPQNFQNIS